ncbi:uncharacterized protein G2W53_012351 [Senna tora]|uniref:Uncharacterized protein n=1 Tax=Senna tora TaxID=362788 RepID=A0A834TWX4_9FABA|nr:uncharacterized protein G2W53_012351 [Senna tora]
MEAENREKLSSEEADLYARSNKKVKTSVIQGGNCEGTNMDVMDDSYTGDRNQEEQGFVSFRDKLLLTHTDSHNVEDGEVVLSDLDGSSSEDDSSSEEEGDVGEDHLNIPVLEFSQEEYDQWQCSELKAQSRNPNGDDHSGTTEVNTAVVQAGLNGSVGPMAGEGSQPIQKVGKGKEDDKGNNGIYGPWMLPKKPNRMRNIVPRKSSLNVNHGSRIDENLGKVGTEIGSEAQLVVKPNEPRPYMKSDRMKAIKQKEVDIGKQVRLGPKSNNGMGMKGVRLQVKETKASSSSGGKKTTRDTFVNPVFEMEQAGGLVSRDVGPRDLGAKNLGSLITTHDGGISRTTSSSVGMSRPSKPPDLNIVFMEVGEENNEMEDMQMHEVDDAAHAARS